MAIRFFSVLAVAAHAIHKNVSPRFVFQRYWVSALVLCVSMAGAAMAQTGAVGQDAIKEVNIAAGAVDRVSAPDWLLPSQIPFDQGRQALSLLLSDTQINLALPKPQVYSRRALQAMQASALNELGTLQIAFNPAYQTVQLHHVSVHRSGQVIQKLPSLRFRFLQRETQFEAGIYTGLVTMVAIIDDLRVGDTLDVAYSVIGQNPVFGNKFTYDAAWQSNLPVAQRRLVLTHPSTRAIQWRWVGDVESSSVTPQTFRNGANTQLVFRQDDITALSFDALMPPRVNPLRWLQLSEYASWNEVARWATTLFPDADVAASPELRPLLERIRSMGSDEDKTRAVQQYVQGEIRYFSISLGESSHRPYAPDMVAIRRFGDCKDKTLLMVSLLRAAGVKADPVLVSTLRGRWLAGWLPSPALFDHVIVRASIGGRDYYIDPTRAPQSGLLARQGQVHEGQLVLPVAASSQNLVTVTTPGIAQLQSVQVQERALATGWDKPVELEVTSSYQGVAAEALSQIYKGRRADDLRRLAQEKIRVNYPTAEATADVIVSYDSLQNRLQVTEKFSVKDMLRPVRDDYVVSFSPSIVISELRTNTKVQRKTPLYLGQADVRVNYSFSITLPEGTSGAEDPSSKRFDNPYFNLQQNRRFRGNQASDELVYVTKLAEVPVDKLQDYDKQVQEALEGVNVAIFIAGKQSTVTRQANETETQAFARRYRARLEAEVTSMSKTIAEGKVKGGDLAGVHEMRASLYSDLGKLDLAMTDIQTAMRLAPSSGASFFVRGGVYFRHGELQRSLADLTRALQLGFNPGDVYRSRGLVHLYLGRTDAAIADFKRSYELHTDEEARLWPLIWQLSAVRRANQNIDADLKSRIHKELSKANKQEWPRPLLQLFQGQVTPDQLLRNIEAENKGDDKELVLCEAYFYIGQWHLMRGDKLKAREFLEKSLAQGALSYMETASVQYEIKALNKPK
jgi:lipoprotein NlpI